MQPTKEVNGFSCTDLKKNDESNIADNELEGLQDLAKDLLARTQVQIEETISTGKLEEIFHGP